MANWKTGGLLMAVVLCATGCVSGESFVDKHYDFRSLERIAVVDIQAAGSEAAENEIATFCEMELLKKGYRVIERTRVQAVLSEQAFQASDVTTTEGAARAGRILNVKAVMVVDLPEFGNRINMTGKIIDVEEGIIRWVGYGSATTGRTLATVAGAVVGGGAGVAAGGDRSSRVIAGAAGAVVGGVIGHELSPRKRTQLRKAIRDMMRELPAR